MREASVAVDADMMRAWRIGSRASVSGSKADLHLRSHARLHSPSVGRSDRRCRARASSDRVVVLMLLLAPDPGSGTILEPTVLEFESAASTDISP